jgi:tetratricopeptide (TPR) repeat protein
VRAVGVVAVRAALVAGVVAAGVSIAVVFGEGETGRVVSGMHVLSPAARRDVLRRAAERRPDDYNARIAYARFLSGDDSSYRLEAIRQLDAAAKIDASKPEPAAYAGWLIALSAQTATRDERATLLTSALARLDRAIALDPRYSDAFAFKGLVLFEQERDAKAAIRYFRRYLQLAARGDSLREVVLGALAQAQAAH